MMMASLSNELVAEANPKTTKMSIPGNDEVAPAIPAMMIATPVNDDVAPTI